MPNALTGDFEAVLEVSSATLDRLLASMHQNAFVDTTRPSLPHVGYFRLGDDDDVEGERGSVAAQIGVPHIVLIHGATDRFRLEIGFRARYRADPGSAPLADIIHGTVRAEYRFQDIDPNCWGWQGIAAGYLWIRVVEDSVAFDGTAYNESGDLTLSESSVLTPISLVDEQLVKAHIAKHLAALLKTQFEPTPQRIGRRFRRMRSLAFGVAPGQSGVAIPFGLSSETPASNLGSINELFLGGRDFGLAVSSDYIISAIQPKLDPIVGLQLDFHIHGDAGVGGGLEIDYHVRIDSVTAEWLGPFSTPSSGLMRIGLSGSGWATRLYRSGVFNIGSVGLDDLRVSFAVDQLLVLSFEQAAERVLVTSFGAPSVSVNYGGPFAAAKGTQRNRDARPSEFYRRARPGAESAEHSDHA